MRAARVFYSAATVTNTAKQPSALRALVAQVRAVSEAAPQGEMPYVVNRRAMAAEAGDSLKSITNVPKLAVAIFKLKSFRRMVGTSQDMIKDALLALEEAGAIAALEEDPFYKLRDALVGMFQDSAKTVSADPGDTSAIDALAAEADTALEAASRKLDALYAMVRTSDSTATTKQLRAYYLIATDVQDARRRLSKLSKRP